MPSLGEGGETEADASGGDGHGAARASPIRERTEEALRQSGLTDPEGVGAFAGAVGGDGGGMVVAAALRAATARALHTAHVLELIREWIVREDGSERSRGVKSSITSKRGTATEQLAA